MARCRVHMRHAGIRRADTPDISADCGCPLSLSTQAALLPPGHPLHADPPPGALCAPAFVLHSGRMRPATCTVSPLMPMAPSCPPGRDPQALQAWQRPADDVLDELLVSAGCRPPGPPCLGAWLCCWRLAGTVLPALSPGAFAPPFGPASSSTGCAALAPLPEHAQACTSRGVQVRPLLPAHPLPLQLGGPRAAGLLP